MDEPKGWTRRWGATVLVALLALLAPAAAAQDAGEGAFEVEGPMGIVDGGLALSPLAALLDDTARLVDLALRAPSAEACFWEQRYVEAEAPGVSARVPHPSRTGGCFPLSQVRVSLIEPGAGYAGLYPHAAGSLEMDFHAASVESRALSLMGSREKNVFGTQEGEEDPRFFRRIDEPHLLAAGSGALSYAGPGALKAMGPTLRVDAAENGTEYETGVSYAEAEGVRERVDRWLVIRADEMALEVSSSAPAQVAARSATFASRGVVSLLGASGEMRAGEATYQPDARREETLRGELAGALAPTRGGRALDVRVAGALASTSMRAAPAPAAPEAADGSVLVPLALGAAVGGGFVAGGVLLLRLSGPRVRRVAPVGPMDAPEALAYLTHYAELAGDADDPELELEWLTAARDLAPDDPDLLVWEALVHKRLGLLASAVDLLEEARRLAPPAMGMPDYYLAAIHMEEREPTSHEQALIHLERALARQPDLAASIDRDPAFAPLGGEHFNAMLEEAYGRLHQGGRRVGA